MYHKYGIITEDKIITHNCKNNGVKYLSRESKRLANMKEVVL